MYEYILTLEIRYWGFLWPVKVVDTFVVQTSSASKAVKLARDGFVTGIEKYGYQWDDECLDLSHIKIRILSCTKV